MTSDENRRRLAVGDAALAIVQVIVGATQPTLASYLPVLKLVPKLGALALPLYRTRRLRLFAQRLTECESFDELRLRERTAPDRETVERGFRAMLAELESSPSDETVGPMVQLAAIHLDPNSDVDRAEILALARLLGALRGGDVSQMLQLVRNALAVSSDDPVMVWNGARIQADDEPAIVVRVDGGGKKIGAVPSAARLFRLLKQADLGADTGSTLYGYEVSVHFLPSGDQSLAISRRSLELLARIFN